MSNEQFYDEQIAPELLRLAKECEERGMGFVSSVEYDPGDFSTTANAPAMKSMAGLMTYYAARSAGNIDKLAITVARDCRENKRPHSSIVLQNLGVPLEPET